MHIKPTLLSIVLLLSFTFSATAQQQKPLADRLTNQFKSEAFNLGFLLQADGYFSFDEDNFNGGRAYDLGATRLDFRGMVASNFTYRL